MTHKTIIGAIQTCWMPSLIFFFLCVLSLQNTRSNSIKLIFFCCAVCVKRARQYWNCKSHINKWRGHVTDFSSSTLGRSCRWAARARQSSALPTCSTLTSCRKRETTPSWWGGNYVNHISQEKDKHFCLSAFCLSSTFPPFFLSLTHTSFLHAILMKNNEE